MTTPEPQGHGSGKRVLVLGSYAASLLNFRGPLIDALRGKGHEVLTAAPEMPAAIADALRARGAEPLSLRLNNASLNPFSILRSLLEIRRLLRLHRPDVLIPYTILPVILGAIAGRAEGVEKIIAMITGAGFAFTEEGGGRRRQIVRRVASRLYRAALARSDLVLFQNPDDQALFRQLRILSPTQNSAVINGSGVDLDHFSPAPLSAGISFLMIARLVHDKGIREFASAAKRIRREHPDVPVSLVGYRERSLHYLTERELAELMACGIQYHGRLEDVRPAIAACSIYVLPSYREGTPRSVLEAMAMGRAIITTDAPGCRETVVDGVNGVLVPVRDAEALYSAMKGFIRNPELARSMGAQSRIFAEQRYDARKVSADILRHAGL